VHLQAVVIIAQAASLSYAKECVAFLQKETTTPFTFIFPSTDKLTTTKDWTYRKGVQRVIPRNEMALSVATAPLAKEDLAALVTAAIHCLDPTKSRIITVEASGDELTTSGCKASYQTSGLTTSSSFTSRK